MINKDRFDFNGEKDNGFWLVFVPQSEIRNLTCFYSIRLDRLCLSN